jgi:hypothetical protein
MSATSSTSVGESRIAAGAKAVGPDGETGPPVIDIAASPVVGDSFRRTST